MKRFCHTQQNRDGALTTTQLNQGMFAAYTEHFNKKKKTGFD